MGLDNPPVGKGEPTMIVRVFIRLEHPTYARSKIVDVRVVEGPREGPRVALKDDWIEVGGIFVEDELVAFQMVADG